MKQQFVVAHRIHEKEIPTLIDSWVTNTPSVKMLYPQKNCFSLHFHKDITCLHDRLLWICQVFSVSCKTVYWRIITNCHFMSNILAYKNVGLYHHTYQNCTHLFLYIIYFQSRKSSKRVSKYLATERVKPFCALKFP
jgi:hypothetical protein